MSVTFTHDGEMAGAVREVSCGCAQFAPTWGTSEEDRAEIRAYAWKLCGLCRGEGFQLEPVEQGACLNVCNANARALLALLGFCADPSREPILGARATYSEPDGALVGGRALPEFKRAIWAARARFDRRAPELARADEVAYGAPRTNADGTVELRPLRMVSGELTESRLAWYLERLDAVVAEGERCGAQHVRWS